MRIIDFIFRSTATLCLCAVITGCVAASSNNNLEELETPALSEAGAVTLPRVELADLEGKENVFPKDLPNKYNFFIFGFAHEQKELTQTWIDPVLEMQKTQTELSVFKVPVIDKKNAAIRTMIRNGMRTGISGSAARQRTLTMFVDKDLFVKAIGQKDDTQPVAIVFDQTGKVLWQAVGAADSAKLSELSSFLGQSATH